MIVFDRETKTGVRNKLLDLNKDLNDIKQKRKALCLSDNKYVFVYI